MRTLIAAVTVLTFANPALAGVVERRGHVEPKSSIAKNCRDTITLARAEEGLPPETPDSSSDDPLHILADEKRINGCPVLVMARDHRDIRPMPKPRDGRAMLHPLASR